MGSFSDRQTHGGWSDTFMASYGRKDLILYAASIGCRGEQPQPQQPLQPLQPLQPQQPQQDLSFLYENHKRFQAFPSFVCVLAFVAQKSTVATLAPANLVDNDSRGKENDTQWVSTTPTPSSFRSLPRFPPPMMEATGVIPSSSLTPTGIKALRSSSPALPVLHVWQRIEWHQCLPVPSRIGTNGTAAAAVVLEPTVCTDLQSRFVSVNPKSVGTFVTNETLVSDSRNGRPLCTMQSTSLVLGMPVEGIQTTTTGPTTETTTGWRPNIRWWRQQRKDTAPSYQWTYTTQPNQALLYRLNGDTNKIHVQPSGPWLGTKSSRPVLHGLCTLGIALRGLIQYCAVHDGDTTYTLTTTTGRIACQHTARSIECKFTKPVLVGDTITLVVWQDKEWNERPTGTNVQSKRVAFQVRNEKTGVVVVNDGFFEYNTTPKCNEQTRTASTSGLIPMQNRSKL